MGLSACRQAIRAAGSAIRAIHRDQRSKAEELTVACHQAILDAQVALADHPSVAHAGFLFDAEKEYAEAVLTAALVDGRPLPGAATVGVGLTAWLNGLTEAASELRRRILDLLRAERLADAEALLAAMDDVYDLVVAVDFPDALTGGLRRRADALRAVLERTRSDLTTTTLQHRLQTAIEGRTPQA